MDPEEKHLFDLVSTKYGHFIEAYEIAHIKNSIADIVSNARALREVHLSNSVEPFSVFSPFSEPTEHNSGEINDE